MVSMFPDKPRADTDSNAELLLFQSFKSQLSPSYQVHHSVSWQIRNPSIGVEDGETDFVIVDPTGKIMVLEVKGGSIEYDGPSDRWYQNGRLMDEDPIRQSARAKRSLINKLKDYFGKEHWFTVNNAIAFPDVSTRGLDIRLDAESEIVLDRTKIKNLQRWVDQYFLYITPEEPQTSPWKPGKSELTALSNLLCPSHKFSKSLRDHFSKIDQIVEELTEEQYRIIQSLQRFRKVAFSGCAGSGKTLIAIEKALRLDHEGFSVLFLCHNIFLAKYLREIVRDSNIIVTDFNSLVYYLIKNPLVPISPFLGLQDTGLETWTQFSEPSGSELADALDNLSQLDELFDAVIVDEGQDFKENWWLIVEACLNAGKDGILYIFYDENQTIYPSSDSTYGFPVEISDVQLSRNCRNAGNIFEMVQKLHPSAPTIDPKLAGIGKVFEEHYSTEKELYISLAKALEMLENASHHLKDVIILSADIASSQQCEINGYVFDTKGLQERPIPGQLDWKQAIVSRLGPYNFSAYSLSNDPLPNKHDVRHIRRFCVNKLFGPLSDSKKLNIRWEIDHYGKLDVTWNIDYRTSPTRHDWMAYFADTSWANQLPSPHKLYRLTSTYELGDYPNYIEVKLADIPSFKGLEASAVILVINEFFAPFTYQQKQSLYVALSRARSLLYVICPFLLEEKIQSLLKF